MLTFTLTFAQIAEYNTSDDVMRRSEDFVPDTADIELLADSEPLLRPEEPSDALALQIGETGGIVHVLSSMGIGT
ncbi:MAG TPA: hypothetical protein ENN07_01190, partial [candidate division Zixibacteria bacterium]|nr:hypothetical protein [candidate division Zixibacteria bacterium]